ncbi:hypothetical protein THAOC_29259 [Thalassiosira oceanica]|uniref:Uncharacterized protein n=1 Tax=Thalassiosira oceanica TaxID=159749 RepID=K0RCY0_THAOC|nr:hypothetical protein THAOC_29259 [Thalassiosira oceanica]|eukprot:EJK51558.1 hypothetical protein THAOC_29259 [Thalassiosira oceanica]
MRRVFISVPTQSKDPVKSQSKAPTSNKKEKGRSLPKSRKQYPFQQSPVVLSEELDPVLLGRLPLEHRAPPLPLEYPERPPDQLLVRALERHP